MKYRRLGGCLALALGMCGLILTGFDAVSVNYAAPTVLPVVGLFFLMLGTFLLLISGSRSEA